MAIEAGDESQTQGAIASAFWWRLTDNLFRRAIWLLIPIALFTTLGLYQASKTLEVYQSTGVLSASNNPLVPDQQISPSTPQWWETPAVAASRTINEQLRTDAFIEAIADRAGLTDAIESGLLTLEVVRINLWSSADGTSLVKVNATWGDPQTAFGLVVGAIGAYQEFLAETVASQSSEAVTFYTSQLAGYELDVTQAQDDLDEFITSIPDSEDGDERSISVDMQLTRLTTLLTTAEAKVASAQEQIEKAELAVTQSKSEAGRSLTVIDEPKVPTAPQSTLMQRAMTVVSFALLGVVIAFGALLIGTVLDQSVASASDLRSIDGVALVTAVPALRLTQPSHTDRPHHHARSRRGRREKPSPREQQKAGV